jgi:hypothetical protein
VVYFCISIYNPPPESDLQSLTVIILIEIYPIDAILNKIPPACESDLQLSNLISSVI